jgi:hypothetical protein
LKNWAPVKKPKFKFQEAHHKMSDKDYNQLKKLILQKNPEKNTDNNIMINGAFQQRHQGGFCQRNRLQS